MASSKYTPVFECRNVWKIYKAGTRAEVQALRGVDFVVKQGDFVSIQGASGSGKSTLMNCIGCLDVPTRGRIFLNGRELSKLSEDELAKVRRENIGFVFQFFNLIPSFTAIQNVELPMIFKGVEKEERLKRARKLLKDVGLGERMGNRPGELSGGERQRVAIARALANDPVFILADEPTGNLDSKTGEEIIKIFKGLQKDGKTIVMITHDENVGKCAQRIIRMKDGKITSDR